MAKKGKRKKARKKADQNLHKIPAQQLVQEGESWLAAGNYRQAIKILKIAYKKESDHPKLQTLLVRAYAHREGQLRQKGMVQEAEALHHQILRYLPDAAQLDVSDLLLCLKSTSLNTAVSLYRQFLMLNKPVRDAEMVLAGTLLISQDWQAAGQLPDKALLKPDVPLLQEAARLMNEARWEEALARLQPIARSSPLSAVKLLCRAMVCFHQSDDTGMQRALSMIPESFVLFPLVERLKKAPQSLAPLWQGQWITHAQTEMLLRAIKDADFATAARCIKKMAQMLRPQDPYLAIEQLLYMLWSLIPTGILDSYDLAELATSLLPDRQGRAVEAKIYFLEFEDDLQDTSDYLEVLDQEFPDPEDRRVATSMVLSESVKWIVKSSIQREAVGSLPDDAQKQFGITSQLPECALLEMILKSLELDSCNRQAYKLLTRLPRKSRQAKQLVEKGLLMVIDHWAADPHPWLALAKLYYEKNAFRKAQNCLRQAEQRAPHDELVKDFHVQALLKSIDTNLKRQKHHLIKKDLEKAAMLGSQKTLAHIAARRILFEIEQTGQLSLFDGQVLPARKGDIRAVIEQNIADLTEAERLKVLGILKIDSWQRSKAWNKTKCSCLETVFKRQKATLNAMPSKTIRSLLLPDTDIFPVPGGRVRWLGLFLDRYKQILQKLNEKDILPVLEALLEADRFEQCHQEIGRRLRTAPEPFQTLLRFYQMVVQHITGQNPAGTEDFTRLIEQVPPQHLELFRAAARRLSKSAVGPLQVALEHFKFELLEKPCNCPLCSGQGDPDEEDWEDVDPVEFLDTDMDDPFQSLIDGLEGFVDKAKLRGAPKKELQKLRKEFMSDIQNKMMFGLMAELLPPEMTDKLSPEVHILIFG
jgi:tetratricopeptide (TPR) repeat protein